MALNYLIIDIATAPLPDADQFIDDSDIAAPSNYGPEAAEKFIAKARAAKVEKAGLDMDLCRISGMGVCHHNWKGDPAVDLCKDADEEARALRDVAKMVTDTTVLVGFNALKFDWPVLMRRARYLGVPFPKINLDRYRSSHLDLFNILTNNGTLTGHSLQFYRARLGWLDVEKPLQGAEEARVFQTGKWDELETSIRHDVICTHRLGKWLGVL